jgi:hypothetical protein
MRAIVVHKINQVIHIAILLKGDTQPDDHRDQIKIYVYLASSLFTIKCPHSVITRHYAFYTIYKGVIFLSFIHMDLIKNLNV